jgi:uncharacterized cupredoxin-like copper-binding protein
MRQARVDMRSSNPVLPGRYNRYCSISGHRSMGMVARLTVT